MGKVIDLRSRQKILKLPTERQEQRALVKWLTLNSIRHFAIPNGGTRNLLEAINLKREGVKAGVPDLMIPIPMPQKSKWGLYIELKREWGGIVSPEQKEWLQYLNSVDYVAVIAHGCHEAIEIVREYLGMDEGNRNVSKQML